MMKLAKLQIITVKDTISMRSSSGLSSVSIRQKWKEAITLFSWLSSEGASLEGFNRMFRELDVYRLTYEQYTGRPFASARTLEIGYGSRPFRLIAVMSMGIDARGIDLDMPMLRFSLLRLFQILKRNGIERALKTCVRNLLFDHRGQAKLRTALEQRGYTLTIDPARFLVGDAATYNFGAEPVELVYSTDVFEHIPLNGLESLLERLAAQTSPQGLLLITVNIFTGITGGHLPEWYTDMVDSDAPKESDPWEHLRKRRYTPNTYLNGCPALRTANSSATTLKS
jgi:Methyltransferase domain